MLRWLQSLTDPRALGSVAGARKFAGALSGELFADATAVGAELRRFAIDDSLHTAASMAPLLAFDRQLADTGARLERDYIAASLQ